MNVVLTRSAQWKRASENEEPNHKAAALSWPEEVQLSSSLDEALKLLGEAPWREKVEHIFVIGGGQVMQAQLHCSRRLITVRPGLGGLHSQMTFRLCKFEKASKRIA